VHAATGHLRLPRSTTSPPSSLAGYSSIENDGGIVLAIPDTINEDSPAFK